MDKVSMSLDDIIKMNRKGGPRPNGNRGNMRNQPNNTRGNRNQQPQKKFGLLNKSKGINKNKRLNNRRGNNFLSNKSNNNNRLNNQRRQQSRLSNLKARLTNTKPIGRLSKPRPQGQRQQQLRTNGNKMGLNRQQRSIRPNRQQPPRRADVKAKLAIQAARKNVEKAKRLLANRVSKVKELASRIGNKNSKVVNRQKPFNRPVKRLNNKRPNTLKANFKNKPQINRQNNRQQNRGRINRGGRSNGRMVLY
ncbi:unnamed protein product [Brachionus calyciflorus]|uniref:Uncharacterized protein n=1 Tax=Brachionus calyciflorus TaxID=104777 RepID=A0A813NEW1_9BILA|nr:unnamed protein product [Brachionus calyciflorus]